MSNPFEKYVQASQRQNQKLVDAANQWAATPSDPSATIDTSLAARYADLGKPVTPDPTLKSAGDLLVDAAASAAKIPTIVGGVAVGAADLALSAASKPIEGYMRIGNALAPNLIPEPMDVGIGYIAKGLHDTIGYDPERAKQAIDDAMFSDARKIQEKEYQSGYTAAEDKAFQDSWVSNYQAQVANLQKAGATEQQLKDFNTGFDKQYQEAATQRADKYQTSWDKPLSENINIIGHGFNNLLENPSLALGGAIESAGYLLPSMAVSRGVLALEKAAKVAKLGAGGVGAIQPLHRFAAAGVGEGSVAGTVSLEQMRSQIPDGIAGGKELLGALGVAASTGLIGTGFGKAASKLGVGDIDAVGLGRAASQVAAMKLPALARPVGAVAQEGAEEFAQTFGESIIPNVTMGKDPLEGLGQELPLGTMAGAIMGAGMNAPSLVTGGFSDISSGLGKVKDAASLKSFDTLSNPEHKNYNPAQAFNTQLKNLESNDETVRTQAEASVSKIETDLNTARASVEKRIKSIQATLKAMPPSDQTTDAQKLEIEALGKEYSELTTKSSTLADQYVAFLDAQVTAQEHRDAKQGTQFTEEQAKADIATLTQPQTSTVMTVGDTQIPVQVEGEAKVLADGIEKVIVNYTDAEGNVKKEVVPTSSLASVESTDTTAQQEALNRVTRHFSKYSNDDLDLLATSPVFNEAQRNSLRLMSKSKRELAAVQDPSQVFDNILNGYKGKTIQESHRGLNQYTDMVNTAVATKNEQLASLALDGLGAFTDDHTAKKDVINEAFGLVQKGTYKEIRVVRTEDGTWGFVPFTAQEVRVGKNADGVVFLEDDALKEALNEVGGFNVHINSDKPTKGRTIGAITQVNNETQLIQDRFNALSGVAESFVGVTPKPVDTSTAPTVDAPIVAQPSDTTAPTVTPVPEAPVQSGAMTPEVNQSLEDYIKSLGRTSTDKYKQDLLTTFNAEVDKNISNGYVGGLVGSTKEYNKEKHAVLVAIALSKGYTVGTPVVGNGVYTATLTKSTATPATPATPTELKKGTVVEYKLNRYLFVSQDKYGNATLSNMDGSKFYTTPKVSTLTLLEEPKVTSELKTPTPSQDTDALALVAEDEDAVEESARIQFGRLGRVLSNFPYRELHKVPLDKFQAAYKDAHSLAKAAGKASEEAFIAAFKEVEDYLKSVETKTPPTKGIGKDTTTATPTETKTPVQAEVTTTPSQDTTDVTEGGKQAPTQTTENTGKDNKADLILPIGTSGSGKSTWIKSVNSEGDYTVISLDDLRVELTGDVDNKTSDEAVYAEAIKRAVDAVKVGKQVIFDTTNLKKDRRVAIIEAIRKAKPNANIQYKLLPLDPALAKQRIKDALASGEARANVDDATIDRHAKAYVQALEDIKQEGITAFPEIVDSNKIGLALQGYTNHSGGAYGADTLWDTIGRSLGFTNHNHYRDGGNQGLSAKLKQAGVKAVVVTKEQMQLARDKIKDLLGITYLDNLQGNLQVRNFYQVSNSDGVYAVATLSGSKAVKGGTNTAVQLGIKLGKPVYVWDVASEQWFKFDTTVNQFKPTETPILTKNYAGVGTRDIENYNVLKDGKWSSRKEYVGDAKAAKAQQAIKDVYVKTLASLKPKAEPKVKTAEATPPVVSGIKTEGNNTLITSAVSGLTHSVPTKLVNGIFEASYIVKELMAITSKALSPAQREYLEGLLQVFLALDGTILIGLYADLSLIQNDTIRETLQESKGKAVDYLDEGKRIYIDLNNVEPVDLFEILVHEYHHTVTMQGLKKVEGVGKSSPQYVRLNAAYKAVKAFTDSNPTVDARVLRRLEYMLKNLREFLTVGMVEPTVIEALKGISVSEGKSVYDEISAVNAEILKAQNPKTFPTQQGKLNDLVSTTRGNSSGVQTSSSDSINTPQVESLDTTGNDTKTGNTLRPVATIDGEQTGRGTSEATQSEETSTESRVEPVASEDAKVTVLQGVTDEVAAAERKKPFNIRNILKGYFTQSTTKEGAVGANPLVTVKDFLKGLGTLTQVSDWLNDRRKPTQKQLDQVEHFKKFHAEFARALKFVFNTQASAIFVSNKENLVGYLEMGKKPSTRELDENVVTALALSAYSYLIKQGNKVMNTNEELETLFRLKKGVRAPLEIEQMFRFAGQEMPIVVKALGTDAAKALGLKVREDQDPTLQDRLNTSLGILAMEAMANAGFIVIETLQDHPTDEKNKPLTDFLTAIKAVRESKAHTIEDEYDFEVDTDAETQIKKFTMVRPNAKMEGKGNSVFEKGIIETEVDGKIVRTETITLNRPVLTEGLPTLNSPLVNELIEANKDTKGFLSYLFGVDVGLTTPLKEIPKKFTQRLINGTDASVPSVQAELLTEAQKHSFTMRTNTVAVFAAMQKLGENSQFLKELLGIWIDDHVLSRTHVTERDSLQAKAQNDWTAVLNGLEWADATLDENGQYTQFYDTQFVAQNQRQHLNSNMFSAQSSQIHRAMAALTGFSTTIDLSQDEQGTVKDEALLNLFYQAVGEGLEGLDDYLKADILSKAEAGLHQFFTVDKVYGDYYVPALKAFLQTEDSQNAIKAMRALIETGTIDTTQQKAIAAFVDKGKMGAQSLQSLIALAELSIAQPSGTFTTSIGFGSDGVNHGVSAANMLTGVISKDMRKQTGIFPIAKKGEDQIDNMQEVYRRGVTDYYVDFGKVMAAKLRDLIPTFVGKLNTDFVEGMQALFPKFEALDESGVLKNLLAMRKMAKIWAIPFNYSAGKAALQRALARGFLAGIYGEMNKLANEALDIIDAKKKEGLTAEQLAALDVKLDTVKLKTKTLEEKLNKVLGKYGMSVTLPEEPQLLNEEDKGKLSSDLEKTLMQAAIDLHGKAAWQATEEFAKEYLQVRNVYTEVEKASFTLFNLVRTQLIAEKRANRKYTNVAAKVNVKGKIVQYTAEEINAQEAEYFDLTKAEMAEVDAVLAAMRPMFNTALSVGSESTNDAGSGTNPSGVSVRKHKMQREPAKGLRAVNTYYLKEIDANRKPFSESRNIGLSKEVEENAGVASSANAIQSIDAFVAAKVQGFMDALNVHDAAIFGLKNFLKGVKKQNEEHLKALTNYQLGLEHAKMLVKVYVGYKAFMATQEEALKSEDVKVRENAQKLITEAKQQMKVLLWGEQMFKGDTALIINNQLVYKGGLIPKLQAAKLDIKDNAGIKEAISVFINFALKQDLQKLEVLLDTYSIHQFAGEGGMHQLTDENRASITEQEALVEKAKEDLQAELKGKSVEQVAEVKTPKDTKPVSVFISFLRSFKDGIVPMAELLDHLKNRSDIQDAGARAAQGEVLKAITPLLDANTKVVYSIEDYDGYGYFDEETNTLHINAAREDGVKTSLAVHELLHAVLSRRIKTLRNDIENKTGNNSEAVTALQRLDTLRERLLLSITDPVLRDMLKNTDEFISYGLTESRLQEAMKSTQVDRGGRTFSAKLRKFVEFVGQILGFRSKEISALAAFASDTAALLETIGSVTPVVAPNNGERLFSTQSAEDQVNTKPEINTALEQARKAVRELLVQLNFKFVDSPDVNLSDIERIASKYLTEDKSNNDPAFLKDAAIALSYAIYFELGLPQGNAKMREWLEQSLLDWLTTGEIPKLHKSVWVKAVEIFNKLMAAFSGKEFKAIESRLEATLNKIINREDFSFKPKQGYAKLVFQKEMTNNPLAVQSLLTFIKSGIKFALTGSVAYADQVPLYRQENKPLHDMDFLVAPEDLQDAYDYFTQKDPDNWGGAFTLYDVVKEGKRILGFAIVPKGFVIKNGKSEWNREQKAPERSYDVFNVVTGLKAGSYYFLGGKEEVFTGIAGITIDLLAEDARDTVTQTFKDTTGTNKSIEVSSYVGGFTAKLDMLRLKDITDFIGVVPPTERVLSKPKAVKPTEEPIAKPAPAVNTIAQYQAEAAALEDDALDVALNGLLDKQRKGDKSPLLKMKFKAYNDEMNKRGAAVSNKGERRYSKNTLSGNGLTVASTRQILVKQFGEKLIKALEAKGLLRIVETMEETPEAALESNTEGYYLNGKATLVADGLTAETVVATLLHELSGHKGFQELMEPAAYNALMKQFDKLVAEGNPIALAALKRAQEATGSDGKPLSLQGQMDEYLPYLLTIQAAINATQAQKSAIAKFIDNVFRAVRAWAYKKLQANGYEGAASTFMQPQDIVFMAERMLKEMGNDKSVEVNNIRTLVREVISKGIDSLTPSKAFMDVITKASTAEESVIARQNVFRIVSTAIRSVESEIKKLQIQIDWYSSQSVEFIDSLQEDGTEQRTTLPELREALQHAEMVRDTLKEHKKAITEQVVFAASVVESLTGRKFQTLDIEVARDSAKKYVIAKKGYADTEIKYGFVGAHFTWATGVISVNAQTLVELISENVTERAHAFNVFAHEMSHAIQANHQSEVQEGKEKPERLAALNFNLPIPHGISSMVHTFIVDAYEENKGSQIHQTEFEAFTVGYMAAKAMLKKEGLPLRIISEADLKDALTVVAHNSYTTEDALYDFTEAHNIDYIKFSKSPSAEDHVNQQSSLDIMTALPHSNTGSFNQQLDRLIVAEIGQLYNQDDAAKARIDEIQTFTASDALNAGFSLSRKEQYVQQALQYAVAAYMKLHAGGANVGQLRRVYHAAKAKMDVTGKDFHEGDWATATQQEKDIAKAKYDFLFDSTKEDYMSRFVSMALASESVSKILDIALPLTKPDTQDKTWFEKVNDWVSYVMAWLTNKYVRLNPIAGASNQLVQLMDNLVKLDIRNRQEGVALHQKAWNTIGLVTTPLNKALKGAGGALLSGVGLRESRFLPVRALGAILVLRSEEAAKAIPKMIIDMRNNQNPNTKLGEVCNILLEASGVGTLRDKFDVLIRQTNLNAKNRQDIVDNVKKAVNKWFKEPLTKVQSKAIAYGLLGTDAQALLENYSVEDIVDMALHEGKVNAEIAKLKKEIAKNPNGNDMLNAAEQLGYYMVTRIGGEGLVKNATGIAIGLGTQYFTSVEQADPKLVGQLNTLASMLAMTHVPNSDKAILAALYKTDAEGVHAVIQLHQGLVNDSLKDFQANPLNMVKGWMPEVTNPYLEIKAANSMVERQQMEAEGWVLIDELKRDKHDKGSPKYLMKHNDIGYQRLVSGAVDLGSTARSGTEAISRTSPKYLGITQARYQNAARRAAIPNGSFDPSKQPRGLIAAYDTDGGALAYNYEMDNETRDAHLDRKHNIGDLLGTFGGLNYYKPEKAKQSNKVAEVLFEDYKANYSQNPNAYLKISPKSTDPKVVEMWRMLPQDFRQRATELYGKGNPIIIRNEAFNLAFGFKKFSVVSYAFDAVNAERSRNKLGLVGEGKAPNKFQSGFVRFAEATSNFKSGVIGAVGGTSKGTAQADFAKAEHVTQEIVKAIKDFIVIRSGTTMMWNIFANVLMLMANGINPVTIIKDWVFAVTNVRAYQKLNSQLIQAQADLAGGKDPIALKQRIGALKAELKANVMNPYINAGLLSSIVDDVNIQHGEYTYTSAFKQTVDAKTQWIPKPVKTAAAIATIAPSTKLYQFLATTTQLSDFVAKYTMSKHLQAGGMSSSESMIEASKTFINYDLPTSQGLQYANDMGLFMFTKFFLRIQAVLMKLLGKRAGSTIAQHLLVENLTGAEGVLSPMAFGHIGNNPLESSVAGLPSAFFGIGTIDAVTDFGVSF